MSNQVYSSPQHKYFAQPGVAEWGFSVPQIFAASPGGIPVQFETQPLLNQGNVSFLSVAANGTFTANEEGVYYLRFVTEMTMAAVSSPANGIFCFALGIQLISGNGAMDGQVVDWFKGSYNSSVVGVAETIYVGNTSATVYLPQGATFNVFANNFIPNIGDNLLLQPTSRFFTTKLV